MEKTIGEITVMAYCGDVELPPHVEITGSCGRSCAFVGTDELDAAIELLQEAKKELEGKGTCKKS